MSLPFKIKFKISNRVHEVYVDVITTCFIASSLNHNNIIHISFPLVCLMLFICDLVQAAPLPNLLCSYFFPWFRLLFLVRKPFLNFQSIHLKHISSDHALFPYTAKLWTPQIEIVSLLFLIFIPPLLLTVAFWFSQTAFSTLSRFQKPA